MSNSRPYNIVTVFLDEKISGTPRRIYRISKYIDRTRFRPIVVIPKGDGEFARQLREIDVQVHEIVDLKRLRQSLNPRLHLDWLRVYRAAAGRVRSVLCAEKADLVHAYGISQITGPICAHACQVKLVWHINDDSMPRTAGRWPLRMVARRGDTVTASSLALARLYYGQERTGWPPRMTILYSTVDLHDFKPQRDRLQVRQELGVGPDETLIGMVANFEPSKGHLTFVSAAAHLRQHAGSRRLKFLIAGRELDLRRQYHTQVLQAIQGSGLAADMILPGYRQDIPDILNALDILVVPSVWEPLGVIVMEGMAMARPIVATNAGGIPEMVTDSQHGLLFPPQQSDQLADCITRLLDNPAQAQQMGERARERMWQEFRPEKAAAAYEQLYERLLTGGPA